MFDFFHSIIVKIAVGISSVALFFSGATATPQPTQTTQDATPTAQVQIVATTSPTTTATQKANATTKQDTPKDNKDSLIGSLKKQVADLTQKASQPKIETPKTSVVTLPSGAVVEMDANGNVIRTITTAPQQTYTAPAPTTQSQTSTNVQISSINITPTITSAKIEWQTDKPTESKIFLSGGGLSSKIYSSDSGLSTRHSTSIENLSPNTSYTYEIEAVGSGGIFVKKSGTFATASKVASKIFARPRYASTNSYYEVVGANCQPADYWVSIYDQDGVEMDAVEVKMTAPFSTVTEKTRPEDYTKSKIHAFFRYYTPATSTVETIKFVSGSLSATVSLNVRDGLQGEEQNFRQDYPGGPWYLYTTGQKVDPTKMLCL